MPLVKPSALGLQIPDYCGDTQNPIPPLSAAEIEAFGAGADATATLIQAQVLIRHGDRSPCFDLPCWVGDDLDYNCSLDLYEVATKDDYATTASLSRIFRKSHMEGREYLRGNCGLGQLTEKGYDQEMNNGANLRDAYVTRAGLLSGDYDTDRDQVFLRSDESERTMKSGEALVAGLFPPQQGEGEDGIAVVDWNTMDSVMDDMLNPPSGGQLVCPRLTDTQAAALNSSAYLAHVKSVTDPLDEDVASAFGLPVVPPGWSHGGIDTKLDCVMTHVCNDRPIPKGLTQELFNRIVTEVLWQQQFLFDYPNFTRYSMGKFVNAIWGKMVARMDDHAQAAGATVSAASVSAGGSGGRGSGAAGSAPRADAPSKKLWLYSGHDGSPMMPISAALGFFDNIWTPYAGLISLELYSVASSGRSGGVDVGAATAGGDYAVRAIYDGVVRQMTGCSSTLCAIDEFQALVQSLYVDDDECMASNSESVYQARVARALLGVDQV